MRWRASWASPWSTRTRRLKTRLGTRCSRLCVNTHGSSSTSRARPTIFAGVTRSTTRTLPRARAVISWVATSSLRGGACSSSSTTCVPRSRGPSTAATSKTTRSALGSSPTWRTSAAPTWRAASAPGPSARWNPRGRRLRPVSVPSSAPRHTTCCRGGGSGRPGPSWPTKASASRWSPATAHTSWLTSQRGWPVVDRRYRPPARDLRRRASPAQRPRRRHHRALYPALLDVDDAGVH